MGAEKYKKKKNKINGLFVQTTAFYLNVAVLF